MSIIDTQQELVRKRLLLGKLKEGFYPSILLIEQLVEEAFQEKIAGLPRFTFREQRKGEASRSSHYNESFQEVESDLIVSFEEIKRLNNRMMSLSHYYESNRMKINKMLQELEMKTHALEIKAKSEYHKEILSDSLHSFRMIDFKGDIDRNIPKTVAFVNLTKSDVEIKRQKNGTYKHDLSKAKVSFQTDPSYQIIHLTSIQEALNDLLHDAWRTIVVTKEPTKVTATLTIEFEQPIMATNISMDMQAGKPVYTTLLVSDDGKEFVRLERQKIISDYQWIFETRLLHSIRFELEKPEEDRPNGGEFEYIFGAKNIEVTENEYESKAVLVSKPHFIEKEAIHKIELQADEYLPPDTTIRYYVGFDYDSNMIEWQEIRHDRPVITDMVKTHAMEINRYTEGYADMMFERFGSKFFRIAKLPYKPITGTIDLMIGRNMWLKETIPAPFIYEPTEDESDAIVYQTGVHDWIRSMIARKQYVRVQNGFDYLQANRFHRYTTYIYSSGRESQSATVQGTDGTSHAVFVNSSQIKGVNHKYDLLLQEGWNEIEVYVYAREINQEIILDFYVPNMTNQIFANQKKLEEISLYDLLNNTSVRQHDRFAVDEDNNVIVNYNPKELDTKAQLQYSHKASEQTHATALSDGLEYALEYNYSVSEQTEHHLRFMAILSKEKDRLKVTPRLHGYQLIVE